MSDYAVVYTAPTIVGDYDGRPVWRADRMVSCPVCGAAVTDRLTDLHDAWHAAQDAR